MDLASQPTYSKKSIKEPKRANTLLQSDDAYYSSSMNKDSKVI